MLRPIGQPRARSAEVQAQSLFFLTALGVIGVASAGSLFAAAYVLLMQGKAPAAPPPPSAMRAEPVPARLPTAGVAARAPSPLVPRPAKTPPAAGPPSVATAPAQMSPAGVASRTPSPLAPRPAKTSPAAGSPRIATAPTPVTERPIPTPPAKELPPVAAPAGSADPRSIAVKFALAQGDANFAEGELSSARFYYEQAVDGGDAEAAIRLGETFDPAFLTYGRLRRVRGDPAAARFWYGQAAGLGAAEAKQRLDHLDAEPATPARSSAKLRHRVAPGRRDDATLSPPDATFHQFLERILHPFRGG
jgi:hypothetical protein